MNAPSSPSREAELDRRLAQLVRAWIATEGHGPQVLPVGRWWDVVMTAGGETGNTLLGILDQRQVGGCGPVIADPDADLLMWLVPPGTLGAWTNPYGLCAATRAATFVPAPTKQRPPGPHWIRPLAGAHLVDPLVLHNALLQKRPDLPVSAFPAELLP